MKYDPEKHYRRSIRLKRYDYSTPGAYFVIVCTHNRECLFGEIEDGKMKINDAGNMVDKIWKELPEYYPDVEIDVHKLMPNHLHGIIILNNNIVGAPLRGRPSINSADNQNYAQNQFGNVPK